MRDMLSIKVRSFVVAAAAFCLCSCHTKQDSSYKVDTPDSVSNVIKEVVSTLNTGNRKTWKIDDVDNILIIPIDEGCESCLQKAIDFSLKTHRENLLVVISSLSRKVFAQKIKLYTKGDSSLSSASNHILVDSFNLCFSKGLSDIMPRIYRMKEGRTQQQIMLDASDIDKELRSL